MLNNDEKKYLWNKIEYKKRKIAKETENEIYQMLNSDINISNEDFIKILNSLEYSFKKRLKNGPDMKNDNFISIRNKLPKNWIGVRYSSLKSKEKRDNKKPTIKNTKKEITDYLDNKNIKYDNTMKKSELLKLFENNNILTWNGFINKF
ncbi:MAG: hypothetical protein M0R46_13870 [Candidatus Muirbacterium halophilum]|nr:hypothetical protein [Candidatus Muirbacterium halophilum]